MKLVTFKAKVGSQTYVVKAPDGEFIKRFNCKATLEQQHSTNEMACTQEAFDSRYPFNGCALLSVNKHSSVNYLQQEECSNWQVLEFTVPAGIKIRFVAAYLIAPLTPNAETGCRVVEEQFFHRLITVEPEVVVEAQGFSYEAVVHGWLRSTSRVTPTTNDLNPSLVRVQPQVNLNM